MIPFPLMTAEMKKTPSYLKGLAETHARAAGEAIRCRRLHADICRELDIAERQAARLRALVAANSSRVAAAEAELAACDRLIRKFDERLDPTPEHTAKEAPKETQASRFRFSSMALKTVVSVLVRIGSSLAIVLRDAGVAQSSNSSMSDQKVVTW